MNHLVKMLSNLTNKGDKLEARVTENDRKVLKMSVNRGKDKYSSTTYSNGTVVETRTRKIK